MINIKQSGERESWRGAGMYLLDFHENILVRRELSVESEQLLLLLGHILHTQRLA